jgi:hypothetical protein
VDNAIMGAFENIVGCGLTPAQRVQATLPLTSGGCGIRSPTTVRPAARIAAMAGFYQVGAARLGLPGELQKVDLSLLSEPIKDLQARLSPNFSPLDEWVRDPNRIATAERLYSRQKWWSDSLGKQAMLTLVNHSCPRDQVRILEQRDGLGYAWMAAPPSEALHCVMSAAQYQLGLRWWLGLEIISGSDGNPKCPGCDDEIDRFGDHLVCCKHNNYNRRHYAVQNVLEDILVGSHQPCGREVPFPDNALVAEDLRPADILLKAWEDGCDVAVDLTVAHAWQATERVVNASDATRERWRSFLRRKEKDKHAKHDTSCVAVGWRFKALAFGTWGGLGPEGAKVLSRVFQRAASWQEGDLRTLLQQEFRVRMGVALMREVWALLDKKNYIC